MNTSRVSGKYHLMPMGFRYFHATRAALIALFIVSQFSAIAQSAASAEPSEIWQGIESAGWPVALRSFQDRFQNGHSYLALYGKTPRRPIDMRSAENFKQNMSAHEFAGKSSIGHMTIGWSCADTRAVGFAAQTGEDGQQSEMLKNGWGVTSLVSTFTDGRIQNGDDVQKYFSEAYAAPEVGETNDTFFALVVEVPNTDCESVREFVRNYVLHPAKPYRNFGLVPDPLKFEGGGCGSFAVAALSNSPTLAPLMATFWRTIPIAEKLLGRRTRVHLPNNVVPFVFAKTANDEDEIGMYHLILMNWDSGQTALNLHLVDPELAIYSFRNFAEIATEKHPAPANYQSYLRSLKRSLYFPSTSSEASIDSGYSGAQEINANFDTSFNLVSNAVEQWWQTRRQNSRIQLIDLPMGIGVMIDSTNVGGR